MIPHSAARFAFVAVLLAACTATPPVDDAPTPRTAPQPFPLITQTYVMVLGVRYELGELSDKMRAGITQAATKRLFNAALALIDGNGVARPYLAQELPQLDRDSWRVFPDGRMETTYRLRAGLTWHDRQALTAEDFVFAWRVYSAPGAGVFERVPQDRMEEVRAPDARTLVITWNSPYPDAGSIRTTELEPLPRHILQQAYEQSSPDAFVSLAYWSSEFVGAGPYRLERWQPGSHLEALAFDAHALGRPKIDLIVVRFIPDENTMLTNVLAENVHIAMDNSLRFEHAEVLKREWGAARKGTVLLDPVQPRFTNVQLRPEYADPHAMLDLRVRRALAHAVDKDAINEGLFGGGIPLADQFLPRTIPYFNELDGTITKYPYDVRRAEQLLNAAGWQKGSDGVYAAAAVGRFAFEHWVVAGSQNEKQGSIMADGWRRAGFEVKEYAIPAAQARDGQVRATFPALSSVATGGGERGLIAFTTRQIPSPANRWTGNNRGSWLSPEYDRVWDAFNTTLDRAERNRQAIQMMRLATEDVAQIFLFHNPDVTAHLSTLRGPELGTPDTLINWNIHEWEISLS